MAERIESIDRFVRQVRDRLNRHLWLDILILFRTVYAVLQGTGAR